MMSVKNRKAVENVSVSQSKGPKEKLPTQRKGSAHQHRELSKQRDQTVERDDRKDGVPKKQAVDIAGRRKIGDTYQNFGGRLICAQDAERQRIARELHDDLSQRMALLAIELQQLDQKIP